MMDHMFMLHSFISLKWFSILSTRWQCLGKITLHFEKNSSFSHRMASLHCLQEPWLTHLDSFCVPWLHGFHSVVLLCHIDSHLQYQSRVTFPKEKVFRTFFWRIFIVKIFYSNCLNCTTLKAEEYFSSVLNEMESCRGFFFNLWENYVYIMDKVCVMFLLKSLFR